MSRGRILGITLLLSFLCMAPKDGCVQVPQKIDVSPDGKTLYFAVSEGAAGEGKESNIYALDVEKGRLCALTQTSGPKGWCTANPNGESLYYLRDAGGLAVEELDLKTGAVSPLCGATSSASHPCVVPGSPPHLLLYKGRWELFKGNALFLDPIPLQADYIAEQPVMAVAEDRFAVVLCHEKNKEGLLPCDWEETPARPERGQLVLDILIAERDSAKKLLQQTKVVNGKEVPALSDRERKALEERLRIIEDDIEDVRQAIKEGAK